MNSQLDKRLNNLSDMLNDLDSFHADINSFDEWVDGATEEIDSIKTAAATLTDCDRAQQESMVRKYKSLISNNHIHTGS